jgi:hypothetical protein
MKLTLLTLLIVFASRVTAIAQDKMVIKTDYGGTTGYEDCDREISSLNKLPHFIRVDIDSLLKHTLGEFAAGVKFSHGQIVNVKKYFSKDDGQPSDYKWVVPKYDLKFALQDTTIGITNYCLEIRLDQYGQLLKINWPGRGYKSKSIFLDRNLIKDFALSKAADLNFYQKDYEVNFQYDNQKEQFYWVFLFPADLSNKDNKQYYCIEVNWANMNDFIVTIVDKTIFY